MGEGVREQWVSMWSNCSVYDPGVKIRMAY